MSKVLFLNGSAQSHIYPTLPLVKELVDRGEKVTYFSTDKFREIVGKTGARFIPCDDIPIEAGRDNDHVRMLLSLFIESMDKVIPRVLEHTANEKYDYIIHDSILGCGKQIGEILKLPAISTFVELIQPRVTDDGRFGTGTVSSGLMYEFLQVARKLKKKYYITMPPLKELFQNKGELNIIFSSRYFQPCSEMYGDDYVFIGPSCGYPEEMQSDFPFEKLENKKVMYISMGTIYNNDTSLIRLFIDTFRHTDWIVVISAGYNMDISQLENIPGNIIIKRYVPQLQILKRVDLFITHGGMNSISEAILCNIPMIVIPQSADQPVVARRIEMLGAGVALDKNKLSPSLLTDSMNRVAADREFKENIGRIRESFIKAGGYAKGVDEIFAFKRQRGIE